MRAIRGGLLLEDNDKSDAEAGLFNLSFATDT